MDAQSEKKQSSSKTGGVDEPDDDSTVKKALKWKLKTSVLYFSIHILRCDSVALNLTINNILNLYKQIIIQ